MGELTERGSPIHFSNGLNSNSPRIVFLTVCTHNRKPVLANDPAHRLILEAWQNAGEWLVGRYVILPDHIHLFCAPSQREAVELGRWIRFWKSMVARGWPSKECIPLWQANYWDRDLRSADSYDTKWEYVRQNAVRHGLVSSIDEWPFTGEINLLEW